MHICNGPVFLNHELILSSLIEIVNLSTQLFKRTYLYTKFKKKLPARWCKCTQRINHMSAFFMFFSVLDSMYVTKCTFQKNTILCFSFPWNTPVPHVPVHSGSLSLLRPSRRSSLFNFIIQRSGIQHLVAIGVEFSLCNYIVRCIVSLRNYII